MKPMTQDNQILRIHAQQWGFGGLFLWKGGWDMYPPIATTTAPGARGPYPPRAHARFPTLYPVLWARLAAVMGVGLGMEARVMIEPRHTGSHTGGPLTARVQRQLSLGSGHGPGGDSKGHGFEAGIETLVSTFFAAQCVIATTPKTVHAQTHKEWHPPRCTPNHIPSHPQRVIGTWRP